jgi:hypothetical protein
MVIFVEFAYSSCYVCMKNGEHFRGNRVLTHEMRRF